MKGSTRHTFWIPHSAQDSPPPVIYQLLSHNTFTLHHASSQLEEKLERHLEAVSKE